MILISALDARLFFKQRDPSWSLCLDVQSWPACPPLQWPATLKEPVPQRSVSLHSSCVKWNYYASSCRTRLYWNICINICKRCLRQQKWHLSRKWAFLNIWRRLFLHILFGIINDNLLVNCNWRNKLPWFTQGAPSWCADGFGKKKNNQKKTMGLRPCLSHQVVLYSCTLNTSVSEFSK